MVKFQSEQLKDFQSKKGPLEGSPKARSGKRTRMYGPGEAALIGRDKDWLFALRTALRSWTNGARSVFGDGQCDDSPDCSHFLRAGSMSLLPLRLSSHIDVLFDLLRIYTHVQLCFPACQNFSLGGFLSSSLRTVAIALAIYCHLIHLHRYVV